jgi:hypothetical protein
MDSMDMYVIASACSIDMQYEHVARICSIDMQYTVDMDIQNGYARWTYNMDGHGYLSGLRNTKISSANDNLLINFVRKATNFLLVR